MGPAPPPRRWIIGRRAIGVEAGGAVPRAGAKSRAGGAGPVTVRLRPRRHRDRPRCGPSDQRHRETPSSTRPVGRWHQTPTQGSMAGVIATGDRPTSCSPSPSTATGFDTTAAARALPVQTAAPARKCAEAGRCREVSTASGAVLVRQQTDAAVERSAAIREVLADGDWHRPARSPHTSRQRHLSTVHRLSCRACLRWRPRRREATPIRLLPTEGDDVNELEALTAAEPKRDRYGRPMVTPRNGGKPSPSPGRRRSPTPSTTATT